MFLFRPQHAFWVFPLICGLGIGFGTVLGEEIFPSFYSPLLNSFLNIKTSSFDIIWGLFKVSLIAGLVGGFFQWVFLENYFMRNSKGKVKAYKRLPFVSIFICLFAFWFKSFGMVFSGWGSAVFIILMFLGFLMASSIQTAALEKIFMDGWKWQRAALLGAAIYIPTLLIVGFVFAFFDLPRAFLAEFLTGVVFVFQGRLLMRIKEH